jgi:hypothetical protein
VQHLDAVAYPRVGSCQLAGIVGHARGLHSIHNPRPCLL